MDGFVYFSWPLCLAKEKSLEKEFRGEFLYRPVVKYAFRAIARHHGWTQTSAPTLDKKTLDKNLTHSQILRWRSTIRQQKKKLHILRYTFDRVRSLRWPFGRNFFDTQNWRKKHWRHVRHLGSVSCLPWCRIKTYKLRRFAVSLTPCYALPEPMFGDWFRGQ